jgi:hypothetical protein
MSLFARAPGARSSILPRRRSRVLTVAAVATASLSLMLVVALRPTATEAVTVEGHTGWSVIRCKFKGDTSEPVPLLRYQQMFTDAGRNLDSPYAYLLDQSGGRIDLAGTVITNWYTMDVTLATSRGYTGTDARNKRIDDCVRAASKGGYTVPTGHRTIAAINGQVDSGAAGERLLLDPFGIDTGFVVHEMLHGYALGHSWSNDTAVSFGGAPAEYDNEWDEQSAMNILGFPTNQFGAGPVGLNAYHRDRLGWLDQSRVLTIGSDGIGNRNVTISSIDEPGTAGVKLVRVPVDANDPDHYFTVEYRRPKGWSSGLPGDQVLISEVLGGRSFLLRDNAATNPGRPPWSQLTALGAVIGVTATGGTTATVHIESNIVDQCKAGFVWRDAGPNDRVCVTTTVRQQNRDDNAAAPSRWVNGPSGPHTCVQGYVWREAFAGDQVCVTTAQRTQASNDNTAAASRRVARDFAVFGPNRCKSGNKWRAADARDYVCVSSSIFDTTVKENAAAASRWVAGGHTCIQGFVWREAFPGDQVCVTTSRRTAVATENRTARDRVANVNA